MSRIGTFRGLVRDPFTRGGMVRRFNREVVRRLAAGLIVVGLAVGIWALWPRDNADPTPTTQPTAAETTTTTVPATTTTTVLLTTVTTEASHVVTTLEEAEEILRTLWFGWFEGIYNQDEARIREVVGTQAMLDNAREQFGVMEFQAEPSPEAIQFEEFEILRTDAECLAIGVTGIAPFLASASPSVTSVEVSKWSGDSWVLVSTWRNQEDLWEADCESDLQPLS